MKKAESESTEREESKKSQKMDVCVSDQRWRWGEMGWWGVKWDVEMVEQKEGEIP